LKKKQGMITGKAVDGMRGLLSVGADIAKKTPLGKFDGIVTALDAVGGRRPVYVGILMGSPSDWEAMKGAWEVLDEMDVGYQVVIASAHRTPKKVEEYVSSARERGIEVIIAGAGMAAHLAGAVAAHTTLPVIGVPLRSGALNGLDALYSTVQMPPGMPVATVAIDGAKNAALLACSILSIKHAELAGKLAEFRAATVAKLEKKAAELLKEIK
jgi:5-(carboxyamino)imidazole ribonucleotide mutase